MPLPLGQNESSRPCASCSLHVAPRDETFRNLPKSETASANIGAAAEQTVAVARPSWTLSSAPVTGVNVQERKADAA